MEVNDITIMASTGTAKITAVLNLADNNNNKKDFRSDINLFFTISLSCFVFVSDFVFLHYRP